ncbi:putative zinc-binding metallopeptidase [Sphingomonas sp. 1P06PA]|uniref:zinc-binding metallopeptidase family protein n=1 Tax=Sphingomonas sp. 1P06PA TaxID=554121 RepID=UPI0039A6E2F1
MAPHACPNCSRLIHFEARVCPSCSFTLGFDPAADAFYFLGDGATIWRDAAGTAHDVVVCGNNNSYEVCNWLVSTTDDTPFCRACRHNRTIPDLSVPTVPERWGKIEAAKRRLFHTLIKLGLSLETQAEAAAAGTGQGLAFDFLYDPAAEESHNPQVMTGHDGGLVTLNLIEADDVQRERIRRDLGEPYRTLVGHFRHEVGHHYWSRLVENRAPLDEFRRIFGDETIDYASAMQNHYGNGGTVWTTDYVSAYATMHPWEDFAETFAHYLHIVDALATIGGFGMRMHAWPGEEAQPAVDFDPYTAETAQLVAEWRPFSFAQNAVNRSMGQPDFYPFHISKAIEAKLDYVNRLLRNAA